MADRNKHSQRYKSKPAPPPWVKNNKRRSTTTTHNPPIPPPPKKQYPTQSITSSATEDSPEYDSNKRSNKPKAPRRQSKKSTYKPTPLVLTTPTTKCTDDDDAPNLFKAQSMYVKAYNKSNSKRIAKKPNQYSASNSMIKSKSYERQQNIKNIKRSKSPPPPKQSQSHSPYESSQPSRWKNHPHAKMYNSGHDSGDDIKSNKPPPPPAPGKQPRHKPVEENVNRRYMKNIAGFENAILNEIDKCNVEALLGCMHEGSECLKYFHTALTTFAKQQQTQCANFLKLFKKSKSRYAQLDTMPNFFYAISLMHGLLEETVKQSSQFAKFIQISCLPMISELETQCDEKYKEIYTLTKAQDKKLGDLKSDLDKQRRTCKIAAEKVIVARQRHEHQKQNEKFKYSMGGDNKKHNILANMTEKIAAQSKSHNSHAVTDAYNNAREQEKKFKSYVSEYNNLRMEYINKRNNGKHEIINMEHFRVDSILSVFQKIVSQQRKQFSKDNNRVSQIQNDIVTHIDTMKAKDVLSQFIRLSIETHGEWKAPMAMESTLDIEYRDMFHSIDDAMSITLEINKDAKIPLIVPLLCERIRDLNGFKTEGIFRKSPNKSNMLRIKKRLQVKNFQLNEGNVHVYSALLKEWLRGLDDLLIPKRYYDYCVSMAREGKLDKPKFEVFFSQMPSVNRECLKYLIKFLRELLRVEYQQFTKMGLENIAIVFGPTLLMPPRVLEPTEALQNAKNENLFVASLIENS